METSVNEKKGFLVSVADWFEGHWVIKTVIVFLPTVWLPVFVKFYGVNLGLSDAGGSLVARGRIITILLYILVLFVLILGGITAKGKKEIQAYYKNELTQAQNGQFYYKSILSGIEYANRELCSESLKNMNQDGEANTHINNLRIIAKAIQNCCSNVFDLTSNKILVSIAYCLGNGDNQEEWRWANPEEMHGGLQLAVLTTNPQTVFCRVMKKIDSFVYYNNKASALADNKYLPDDRDKRHRNKGSIIVCDISAVDPSKNETIARAILSISTYTKLIADPKGKKTLKEVEQHLVDILDYYENLIRRELSSIVSTSHSKQ